jgi:hypothetical protein
METCRKCSKLLDGIAAIRHDECDADVPDAIYTNVCSKCHLKGQLESYNRTKRLCIGLLLSAQHQHVAAKLRVFYNYQRDFSVPPDLMRVFLKDYREIGEVIAKFSEAAWTARLPGLFDKGLNKGYMGATDSFKALFYVGQGLGNNSPWYLLTLEDLRDGSSVTLITVSETDAGTLELRGIDATALKAKVLINNASYALKRGNLWLEQNSLVTTLRSRARVVLKGASSQVYRF